MNLTNTQINAVVDTIAKNKKEKINKELIALFEQLKPEIEVAFATYNIMVERENQIKEERAQKLKAIKALLTPFKSTFGSSYIQKELPINIESINITAATNKPITEAERNEIKRKVILATITVDSVDELIEKLSNE